MSSIVADNAQTPHSNALGTTHQRLFYLHDLPDYKVHHDDTDVRGYEVKLRSGEVVGRVDNLVVDKEAMRTRYLEVSLNGDLHRGYTGERHYLDVDDNRVYDAGHQEHIVVPVGMASIDAGERTVYIEGVLLDHLYTYPTYRKGSTLRPRFELDTIDYLHRSGYPSGDGAYAYSTADYRDFDDRNHRGLSDRFYTSGYFRSSGVYDRHQEAIRSKGL